MTDPAPALPCTHVNLVSTVTINRIVPDAASIWYSADITVTCFDCGEPFRWVGVPGGVSPTRPTCSLDQTELRAPLWPDAVPHLAVPRVDVIRPNPSPPDRIGVLRRLLRRTRPSPTAAGVMVLPRPNVDPDVLPPSARIDAKP